MINNKIVASMATIKKRNNTLNIVCDSIINQVDELNIYLNDYDNLDIVNNNLLNNKKINFFLSKEYVGDLGASGKFFIEQDKNAYHFVVDDDIIYSDNYFKVMIEKCKEYENKSIISLHGRSFLQFPIQSYYKENKKNVIKYHFSAKVNKDSLVQFPGSGVMCYHGSIFNLSYKDFKTKNMTDVWVGILAKQNNVNCVVIKHNSNWLKIVNYNETIYNNGLINDSERTNIVNKYFIT